MIFRISWYNIFLANKNTKNRIEKKGHCFIVNVMANKEYYRFCQPSFLYSYLKLAIDRQEGYLSKLTSDIFFLFNYTHRTSNDLPYMLV